MEHFHSVNASGTGNVLETIYGKGCRNYLMFTTDMICGKPQYLPVDVHHPQNPFGFRRNSASRILNDGKI
jgi:dTDP-glucose 4,6-dehydratase